jgi:hypothetical protein
MIVFVSGEQRAILYLMGEHLKSESLSLSRHHCRILPYLRHDTKSSPYSSSPSEHDYDGCVLASALPHKPESIMTSL